MNSYSRHAVIDSQGDRWTFVVGTDAPVIVRVYPDAARLAAANGRPVTYIHQIEFLDEFLRGLPLDRVADEYARAYLFHYNYPEVEPFEDPLPHRGTRRVGVRMKFAAHGIGLMLSDARAFWAHLTRKPLQYKR